MEKQETMTIMKRIKSHYQEFAIDDFKVEEWHKELKHYDFNDVDAKLDDHLKSEVYGEQIPKLFFLTKHLIPSSEKGKIRKYVICCQNCGAEVPDTMFDKHFSRCSSTMVIIKGLKKHFNITVDKEALDKLSDSRFNEAYLKYLYKMLEADLPEIRKRMILKNIYPNNEVDIDKVLKSLVAN